MMGERIHAWLAVRTISTLSPWKEFHSFEVIQRSLRSTPDLRMASPVAFSSVDAAMQRGKSAWAARGAGVVACCATHSCTSKPSRCDGSLP